MSITLQDIKAKQVQYRAVLKAFYAKRAELESLKAQFNQADMELDALAPVARQAIIELRQMGAAFALQIEDDFTPKIPGTEQKGDAGPWTPEDSHHPTWDIGGDPGYDDLNPFALNPLNDPFITPDTVTGVNPVPVSHNGQPLYLHDANKTPQGVSGHQQHPQADPMALSLVPHYGGPI